MSTLSQRLHYAEKSRHECFDSDGAPIESAFRDLGFNEGDLFGEAADELDRLTTLVSEHEKSAAWCEKHKPNGGYRAVCLVCACQKLSAALSRISYLCSKPNEMECGPYDVHCDEGAVVEQVRSLTAQVAKLEDELKARNKSASDRLHNICMALEEDKDKSPFSREAWDELQAENDELRMRVAALKNELDSAVRTTAVRCREMALWPQSIDDEQAYYGRMFAEFIDREFRLNAAIGEPK